MGQGVNARPRTRGPGWPTSPGPESLAIHGFPKLWGRRPRRSPACRSTSGTRSTDPQLHRSQVTGLGRAGRTRVSSSPGHSGNRGSGLGAQVIVPPAPSVPGPPAPGVPVDLKHQAPGHRCAGRPRAPSAEPRGPQPPACRSASSPTSPGPPGSRCAGRPRVLGSPRSSGPRCAGRPRVPGSPACWSTSSAEPRGPHPAACRSASRLGSPCLPVRGPRCAGRPRVPRRQVATSPGRAGRPQNDWTWARAGARASVRGLLVDPVPRKKERGGRKDGRPEPAGPPFPGPRRRGRAGPGRTGRPPPGRAHPPLGKGATRPPPQRRPRADGTATTRWAPPSPSQPGARRPRRGGGPAGRKPPESAPTRRGVRPPSLRGDPTLCPHPSRQHHDPASPKGGTHTPSPPQPAGRPSERGGTRARDPPTAPSRGAGEGGRGRPGGGARGPAGERRRGRIRTDGRKDKGRREPHARGQAPFPDRSVGQTLVSRADFQ